MLTKIAGLPAHVVGLRAEGTLTRHDYESVFVPLFTHAHETGEHLRFLYEFSPDFAGFTAGAALDDFRLGLRYLRLFEKCAVVADQGWLEQATKFGQMLAPCPMRWFALSKRGAAIEWLAEPIGAQHLNFNLTDDGLLTLQPQAPLTKDDFDRLAAVVDPWLEAHGALRGVVIAAREFPGWENMSGFIHHMQFVKSHHKQVRRLALAMDEVLPELLSKAAAHFVDAEIKQFTYAQLDEATRWAGGAKS